MDTPKGPHSTIRSRKYEGVWFCIYYTQPGEANIVCDKTMEYHCTLDNKTVYLVKLCACAVQKYSINTKYSITPQGWAILKIMFCEYCLQMTCNIATTHSDTVYDNKNRLILQKNPSNPCFKSIRLKIKCYSIFQLHAYIITIIAVRPNILPL